MLENDKREGKIGKDNRDAAVCVSRNHASGKDTVRGIERRLESDRREGKIGKDN